MPDRYVAPGTDDADDTIGGPPTALDRVSRRPGRRATTGTDDGPLLSLAAGSVLDAGPAGTLRAAADAGYRAAGLRLDPRATTQATAAVLRRTADDLGLSVLDLEVVRLGPDRPMDDHLRLLDLAATLGARFLLTVSTHPDPADTTAELARLCAAARGGPTRIALEFMRFTQVGTFEDALGVLPDDATVLVDALHLARSGGTPAELAVAGHRIGYLQLCDAPLDAPGDMATEARHHRLPPGTGDLPLAGLLAAAPPGLPLSVEVQSDRLARYAPTDRARHLLDATRRVLAGLRPA